MHFEISIQCIGDFWGGSMLLNDREAEPSRSRLMCKYSCHSHNMAKRRRPWSFKCRPHIYEDFVARSRCLKQGWIIASHSILWDAITCPCLRYLLLATTSKYEGSDIPDNKDPRIDVDWISIRSESIGMIVVRADVLALNGAKISSGLVLITQCVRFYQHIEAEIK